MGSKTLFFVSGFVDKLFDKADNFLGNLTVILCLAAGKEIGLAGEVDFKGSVWAVKIKKYLFTQTLKLDTAFNLKQSIH